MITIIGQSLSAIILFFAISVESRLGIEETYECPPKQEVSCAEVRTNDGYKYSVPLSILEFKDCEQAWNLKNGTCIANSDGENLKEFVKDATLTNVTIISCEELQWELRCDHISFYCLINYTVIDPGRKAQESQHAEMPDWGIAVIVTGAVIVIAIAVWLYHRTQGNGSNFIGLAGDDAVV